MNIISTIIILFLSLYYLYLPFIDLINNTSNNISDNIPNNILYSLYIFINLLLLNIIGNIFKKNKDSLKTIIFKNIKNTILIITFLLIFLDIHQQYNINPDYINFIKTIFIISSLTIKPFITSLFMEY